MRHAVPQQGSNAERSRHHNRQAVLGQIHHAGTMGRAEIARMLSLSTQAVSNIIADLTDDGMLIEKGRRSVGRGLPAVQYAVNPNGAFALGIEVRPDAVFAALLDMQGRVVMTERKSLSDAHPDAVLRTVTAMRDAAMTAQPSARKRLLGAGIVMPGPFGRTGIAGRGTDLPGWQQVDARALFAAALELPIEVGNDANAAALAERIAGAAQGLTTYAYFYFGAGLGLGLVSGGRLLHGAFGNAGEIGHIPLRTAQGTVPLESALSRLSVQRHMAQAGKTADDIETLDHLYAATDPDLTAWLASAAFALDHAVAIVENLFDPQTIILGGAMPATILDHLVAHTNLPTLSVANRSDRTQARLIAGASGRMTATLGAAALVLNRTLTPEIAQAY